MAEDTSGYEEQEEQQIKNDVDFIQSSSGSSAAATKRTVQAAQAQTSTTVRSARGVVLFTLIDDGPRSPADISSGNSVSTTQTQRALDELHDRGLIEVLLPEEASDGPLYGAVPRGEKAAFQILRE